MLVVTDLPRFFGWLLPPVRPEQRFFTLEATRDRSPAGCSDLQMCEGWCGRNSSYTFCQLVGELMCVLSRFVHFTGLWKTFASVSFVICTSSFPVCKQQFKVGAVRASWLVREVTPDMCSWKCLQILFSLRVFLGGSEEGVVFGAGAAFTGAWVLGGDDSPRGLVCWFSHWQQGAAGKRHKWRLSSLFPQRWCSTDRLSN